MRADSTLNRIARAARAGSPWWRVTVSPWWARVLVAGGARRVPTPDAMVSVAKTDSRLREAVELLRSAGYQVTEPGRVTQARPREADPEPGQTSPRVSLPIPDLPEATVARLPEYLRALHDLEGAGNDTVSSEALASAAGVNSAKLRKDLSHLGSYGTRGVGYDVTLLREQIEYVLGLTRRRSIAIVGLGNLGHALAGHTGFATRGFRIAALFDANPARVGERIHGLAVRHIDDLPETVEQESITIAVIATPAHAAQDVADRLVTAGITSILNFSPRLLVVPEGVDVRKVDLAIELQILTFQEHRKSTLATRPRADYESRPASA